MNPDLFDARATGKVVPISGSPGAKHAFLPDPLPPNWNWPTDLWPTLLEAHRLLSTLDGTGRHLQNPDLVLRPLQNREAQKSSSLEGTYTDPREQLLFALDPKESASRDDPANAHREVFNYARALRLRRERHDLPLSLRLIRELHRELMTGVRGAESNPGHFRQHQNHIGRPPRYVPPPAPALTEQLDNFERYLHIGGGLDPLVRAFVTHYQFEAIHPFMDGNGRVGRLFLAITIAEWCGLANQWLYMSDYFDRNKDEYIDRLFRVSTSGEWTEWIQFCLQGVIVQAADTLKRYERLILLNRDFHERVRTLRASIRLSKIVDTLFLTPIIRVIEARDLTEVTYPTARNDLRRLEEIDIITELGGFPQITYFCAPVLDVVYRD